MEEIIEIGENVGSLHSDAQDYSRLSTKSFAYSWTLADFSSCLEFPDATVFSPEFNFENATWRLMLSISSKAKKLNKIKVYLYKTEKGGNGYYIEHKISLYDDKGFFAAKKAKSKYDGDNKFGSKVMFGCDDEKSIQNLILSNDKLIVYCELSVLTALTCKDPSQPIPPKPKTIANTYGKIKKLTNPVNSDIFAKIPKPKPIFVRRKDTKFEIERVCFFLILLFLLHLVIYLPKQNQNHTKEINDLVIDTTLKVITIADALNLTELKTKSLNLIKSFPVKRNISDLNFSKLPDELSAKFKKENVSDYVPPI